MLDRVQPSALPKANDRGLRSDAGSAAPAGAVLPCAFDQISTAAWDELGARSCEPNGYQLADWARAVDTHADGRGDTRALTAWRGSRLIGLLSVVPCSRLYGLPLPALVSADNYSALCTPLLDASFSDEAAAQLLQHARNTSARALVLRDVALEGPTVAAFTRALAAEGLKPRVVQSYARAVLDARGDAEAMLQSALGAKKLRELRRQRKRLADSGEVRFNRAREPYAVAYALDTFLALEAGGWKGRRGTALLSHAGDAAFIRRAAAALAASGQCEIVTLTAGATAVASAIVIRHHDHAFYYKIGVDERFAKYSPGVQLTLDLTRALCADGDIALVDSTAGAGNPMIDSIWQGRRTIGDLFIPLRRHDPLAGLVYAALIARLRIREPLQMMVRALRQRLKKRTTTQST